MHIKGLRASVFSS